ncbi:glycosyltransferase [Dyadobacter sp. CY345]|uniref:glycosyltransferase n=1 Tax=Dyadobacter sp. CY345 TaxID=2909335 RepID=UPI001F22D0EA|nr:glycosyltransferase [Dyadobacter sp. CY345]MCF2447051.1 glycosyltransferase [Dyadobacter sp. CY345]
MKVLRVIPSMNPENGGPCQGIRNSIPALQRLGIESDVVCLDDPNSSYLAQDQFVIFAIGGNSGEWKYSAALSIWLDQHMHRYDAVIIHGLWLYHSYATIKNMLKLRKTSSFPKVYVMPHGMLDPWFQKDSTRKLKAFRNIVYWHLIEKKVINNCDGLLFTCEQELILARQTFKGYDPKQQLNVSYGIQAPPALTNEMKNAFSSSVKLLNDKPYLLFLSRIHPKKGINMLIDAYIDLKSVAQNLPDLVIAGPIDDSYAYSMVEKAKASSYIHFAGMLKGDSKWGAFYGCEAFILPSHQENFGISVVEALACSKPVLISDQVNIYKEIEVGKGGFIGTDTTSGVKNLLTRWFSLNENEKKSMSENAKEVYLKNYEIEETAKLLKQVLQQKN